MSEELPEGYEYTEEANPLKATRPPGWLLAIGLIAITSICVGGLVYAVILDGDIGALATLGQLATIGITGLLTLAGLSRK